MKLTTRRTASSGFSLIEMLAAIAIFVILMIGLLNLLDSSTKISKLEAALADTQENVRYATYHLMRTARMMGGSVMPFARGGAGGNAWVAGEVHDNVATNFSIFGVTLDNMPGSDVLVLRGFFDVAPFYINVGDVDAAGSTVTIRETADPGLSTERTTNDLSTFASIPNTFLNRGLIIATGDGPVQIGPALWISGQYVVGKITASTGA